MVILVWLSWGLKLYPPHQSNTIEWHNKIERIQYIEFILFGLQPTYAHTCKSVLQLYAAAAYISCTDTIDFTFIIYSDWFSLSSISRSHHTILLDAIVANHLILYALRSAYSIFQLSAYIAALAFNGSHRNNEKLGTNEKTKFSKRITIIITFMWDTSICSR